MAARWTLDSPIFRYLRQVTPGPDGELNLTDAVRDMSKKPWDWIFAGCPDPIAGGPNCKIILKWDKITTDSAGNGISVDTYRTLTPEQLLTDEQAIALLTRLAENV